MSEAPWSSCPSTRRLTPRAACVRDGAERHLARQRKGREGARPTQRLAQLGRPRRRGAPFSHMPRRSPAHPDPSRPDQARVSRTPRRVDRVSLQRQRNANRDSVQPARPEGRKGTGDRGLRIRIDMWQTTLGPCLLPPPFLALTGASSSSSLGVVWLAIAVDGERAKRRPHALLARLWASFRPCALKAPFHPSPFLGLICARHGVQ